MIYHTRPEETRTEQEEQVYNMLAELGVSFERMDHEAANTVADCKGIEEELDVKICKNLFLCNRQKTTFYLLMMEGNKRFVTKDFSKEIGTSRLSFAGEEHLAHYLHVTPGSASVLGLLFDTDRAVNLYIDKDVVAEEYIGCHPCKNTSSLKIKTADLLEKILPAWKVVPHFVTIGASDGTEE